jgi:hypothetical protein
MLDNTVTCTSGVPNLVLQPKIKTKSKIPHQAETTKQQQQQQQTLETKNLPLFLQANLTEHSALSLYILPPVPEPTLPRDINSNFLTFSVYL